MTLPKSTINRVAPKSLRYLDAAYVKLPFFEERHVSLAHSIDEWLIKRDPEITAILELEPSESVHGFVRILGRDGWLDIIRRDPPDLRAVVLIREALAYRHDLLDFAFGIQALTAAALVMCGESFQKDRYLRELATGACVGSFALSEKGAGSNLMAVQLSASETEGGFLLNGNKHWTANADTADRVVVLARTSGSAGAIGLSLFIVDASTPGVSSSPMGLIAPRSFGHLHFEQCKVPMDHLIGPLGGGFAIAVNVLERFRATVGATANGFARRALHEARGYARKHDIRNERLADLPVICHMFANIATTLEAAQLTVARAAWEIDLDRDSCAARSSLAKLQATEGAQSIVDQCLQICGASGLLKGAITERLYREVRSLRIYEGTSEIQRNIVGSAVANLEMG